MSNFQPRIAIVGGGPSGLALGLLLFKQGIHSTIYELRSKPTPEELAKPSGMLDLHEESGLTLIRECGLWDDFQAATGDCSESMKVMDPEGKVLHTDEGELSHRPEIPRNALTDMLARNLPPDMIKWNHKVTAVQSARSDITGATEITIDLGQNGTATYDFVIGADGAWSRVRNLLSDVKPQYCDAQFVTVRIRNATKNYPHLAELNGSGSLSALGGGRGIMTHRGPQDSICVYAAVRTSDEHWAKTNGLTGKTASEVKTSLLNDDNLYKRWAPELRDLLATACDEETKDNPGAPADILPLYMLPVGHRWEHRVGVTLIGDTAHLMSPFAGEGVNLALWDSLDLAHILAGVSGCSDVATWQTALDPHIHHFEEAMQVRAQEKAEESLRNKDTFLSENGGQELANFFQQFYGEDRPGHPISLEQ